GSIEGTVIDAKGLPADVRLELRNPDGTALWPEQFTPAQNGAFRLDHVPDGGRFLVGISRFGPYAPPPNPLLYYPSTSRPEEAQVIEVKGAEAKHIEFRLPKPN